MVSDAELIERLREFLRSSDLNTTTNATVRRKLEEDFGINLSDKKAFIREQVDLFLQNELENAEENEVSGDDDEDDNHKEKDKSDGSESMEEIIDDEEKDEGDEEEEDEADEGASSEAKSARKRRSVIANNSVCNSSVN